MLQAQIKLLQEILIKIFNIIKDILKKTYNI